MLHNGTYQTLVLDNVGRKVLRTTGEGGSINALDTRALANSIYLVQVRSANGQQFIKRLVQEKACAATPNQKPGFSNVEKPGFWFELLKRK